MTVALLAPHIPLCRPSYGSHTPLVSAVLAHNVIDLIKLQKPVLFPHLIMDDNAQVGRELAIPLHERLSGRGCLEIDLCVRPSSIRTRSKAWSNFVDVLDLHRQAAAV